MTTDPDDRFIEEISEPCPEGSGVTIDDFYSYMLQSGAYLFVPCREIWPRASVDARLPRMPVLTKSGKPKRDKNGKRATEAASRWLDRNRFLERMIGEDRSAMFDDAGKLRPLSELSKEQLTLLDSIRPTRAGPEAIMPSKLAAIQALVRIAGLDTPARSDVTLHDGDHRSSDIELARWIATMLDEGARAVEATQTLTDKPGAS